MLLTCLILLHECVAFTHWRWREESYSFLFFTVQLPSYSRNKNRTTTVSYKTVKRKNVKWIQRNSISNNNIGVIFSYWCDDSSRFLPHFKIQHIGNIVKIYVNLYKYVGNFVEDVMQLLYSMVYENLRDFRAYISELEKVEVKVSGRQIEWNLQFTCYVVNWLFSININLYNTPCNFIPWPYSFSCSFFFLLQNCSFLLLTRRCICVCL